MSIYASALIIIVCGSTMEAFLLNSKESAGHGVYGASTKLTIVAAFLSVLAFINYFLIEAVSARIDERFGARDTVVSAVILEREKLAVIYKSAAMWSLGPVIAAIVITLLTYIMSNYQGTIVNHATIFGVYLAVFFTLKQKIDEFRRERIS